MHHSYDRWGSAYAGYSRGIYSADFSLQVVISRQNFFAVKGQTEQGIFATSFSGTANDIRRGVDD